MNISITLNTSPVIELPIHPHFNAPYHKQWFKNLEWDTIYYVNNIGQVLFFGLDYGDIGYVHPGEDVKIKVQKIDIPNMNIH